MNADKLYSLLVDKNTQLLGLNILTTLTVHETIEFCESIESDDTLLFKFDYVTDMISKKTPYRLLIYESSIDLLFNTQIILWFSVDLSNHRHKLEDIQNKLKEIIIQVENNMLKL